MNRTFGTFAPWLLALLLAAPLAAGPALASDEDDEEEIPLEQLPSPVLEAAKVRMHGAKMTGASREEEKGAIVYEVSGIRDGRTIDLTYAPDGTLQLVEMEIFAQKLPKAVWDLLAKEYNSSNCERAEEVITVEEGRESLAYYELMLAVRHKGNLEIRISPEGKVLEEEYKTGEEAEEYE